MDVALVDYGAGNLTSVIKGLKAAGAGVRVLAAPDTLADAHAIVIPGVGHFGATASLGPEWRQAISDAIGRDVPLLGICLGLQWLFEGSDEAPDTPGLGLLAGRCFRLSGNVKVPHVGWNSLEIRDPASPLLAGLPAAVSAYFTHSYAAPLTAATVSATTHGVPFASAVGRGRVFGVQFHPEKSGNTGLQVLRNFLDLAGQAA